MKKIIIIIALIAVTATIMNNNSLKADYIIPSGGKDGNFWRPGTTQYISWSKPFMDTTKSIDIYLWNAKTATFSQIASNIPVNNNYYLWEIPATQDTGKLFKIKVVYSNNHRPEFSMMSRDFFPIANAVPTQPFTTVQVYVVNPSSNVQAYPNPASSGITIGSEDKFFSVELFSASGNLVYSRQFDYTYSHSIDAAAFGAGAYTLRVKFLGSTVTENIAIAR